MRHAPHQEQDITVRIQFHGGFGGTHTLETRNPVAVIRKLQARGVDYISVYGFTTQQPSPQGSQYHTGR
jgi:hypothetical protein